MKSTLICLHVMPHEMTMLERFIPQLKRAFMYLDNDNVTIKASLNLNPLLIDWDSSTLKPEYYIDKFNKLFEGIPNINEIITDTSLMGTTQQKRECIPLPYDQFIFVDSDISFPEQLLKYQLEASYQVEGKYIIIPNIVKMWDSSWDILVHKDYINIQDNKYYEKHNRKLTETQIIDEVNLVQTPVIKFGCGMHTLYSKEFWEFIGIPESFGGYGPEDTFGIVASSVALQNGHDIKQYVLSGVYISEDHLNPPLDPQDGLVIFNRRQEFRKNAEDNFQNELNKFYNEKCIRHNKL